MLYDPLVALEGRKTLERGIGQMLGSQPNLPLFDISQADVLFSFGANFTETWISPVAYGRAYGAMRSPGWACAAISSSSSARLSSTAAVADKWVPLAPGTEGLVALALGAIIVELGLAKVTGRQAIWRGGHQRRGRRQWGCGRTAEELARSFAKFAKPLAVPGGGAAAAATRRRLSPPSWR